MLVEMTGALLPSASDSWLCDANGVRDVRVLTPSASTTEVFHIPSANYGYAPYVSSADGTQPPKYTSMTTNDANLTLTITMGQVTEAQAGGASGTACTLAIRVLR